jgi:hypothetical protein
MLPLCPAAAVDHSTGHLDQHLEVYMHEFAAAVLAGGQAGQICAV